MLLLLFLCMSTVAGVPINATNDATNPATSTAPGNVTVIPVLDFQQPATKDNLQVPGVSINATNDATGPVTIPATSPAAGPVTIPATSPAAGPVTIPATGPAASPVTIPATGLAASPVTIPATGLAASPVTIPATSPAPGPLQASVGAVAPVIGLPQQESGETLEELQNNFYVEEGDIMVMGDRNAVDSVWADAIVPYTISHELADREYNIHTAFKMISDVTCIRFVRRTTELNYLEFQNGKGCASFVGCQGGAQKVYFGRTCSIGNLAHEIIHALGLHHEHTRADRDQYIAVLWQSIKSGHKKSFKIKHGNTLTLPYDFDSIMHYGQFFFSKNGLPTVQAKHGVWPMGQRTHLSNLDIEKLNRLYHCAARMGK